MNKKNPIKYIEEIIEYIDDIQGFIKGKLIVNLRIANRLSTLFYMRY
jgi:hypothetical protein